MCRPELRMIRTALQGRIIVNSVMDELIAQQSRIHEVEAKRNDYEDVEKVDVFPHAQSIPKPWQSYHAAGEGEWYGESWDASSQSLGGFED